MAKKAKPTPSFSLGDQVEIKHFGSGRIIELRGALGPNGEQVYRVRYSRKPTPAYIEVLGDQIRLLKAGPRPGAVGNPRTALGVVDGVGPQLGEIVNPVGPNERHLDI